MNFNLYKIGNNKPINNTTKVETKIENYYFNNINITANNANISKFNNAIKSTEIVNTNPTNILSQIDNYPNNKQHATITMNEKYGIYKS